MTTFFKSKVQNLKSEIFNAINALVDAAPNNLILVEDGNNIVSLPYDDGYGQKYYVELCRIFKDDSGELKLVVSNEGGYILDEGYLKLYPFEENDFSADDLANIHAAIAELTK